MPLPPAVVAPHDVPLWDTRGLTLAASYRTGRAAMRRMPVSDLTELVNGMRPHVATRYTCAVYYRAALNELTVSRGCTVTWSELTNSHVITEP